MSTLPRIDVLVVEDDHALSELITRAIRRNDLSTDVAGDVVEATRLLARSRYKVVILDLMLPDGSGFEVLEYMKREGVAPNVIVITAADGALLVRLDRSAVKTVMFKPIDAEHLASYVHTLTLDRSRDGV